MNDRPGLLAAIGANLAEQEAKHHENNVQAGSFGKEFADRASKLDELADRAKTDPAWFTGLSELDRRRISNWSERRYNLNNQNGNPA